MNLSLTSKINILVIAITLITSASLNIVFLDHYNSKMLADIEESVMEISRVEGWDLLEHYQRKGYEELYHEIIGDMEALQHVSNIQFYGEKGHVLIDRNGLQRNVSPDQWILRGIKSQSVTYEWSGSLLRYFSPVTAGNKTIGFLCIVYNADYLQEQLKSISAFTMITTAVLTVFFIVAGIAFSKLLTEPLKAVTIASRRIAEGDLSTHVAFESKDELGALAQNFNSMAERLKNDINRRERIETELRKAIMNAEDEKARTTAIIEAIGDGISIQSRDFRILYQNQTQRDGFGEHIGEYCYQVYARRNQVCEGCPVSAAFEDGNIHALGKSVDGEGGMRYIEITASPLKDSTGKVIAGIEAVRDVTERRRADDSLKLLKEAVEALPIGITIIDTAEKIIYTNPAEAEMHSYQRDNLIGKNSRVLAPRTSWNPMPFEQLHAMGVWKRESVNIRSNGEVFPVQLTSIAVKNLSGIPIGIVTACEDITERKQAHEKLLQRQEALHAVYKIATTLDSSFKSVCDDIAESLSKLLDVTHVLVLQREHDRMKLVSSVTNRRLVHSVSEAWSADCGCDIFQRNKGTIRYAGLLKEVCPYHPFLEDGLRNPLCVAVTDSEGNVVGVVVVADRTGYEITEEKIRLIEIFSRYAGFVIEQDAMEDKLRGAQKMEAIGKLAGAVAHEVRNPLNAILATSEALSLDLGEHGEYGPLLHEIQSQVDRLTMLMQDLLDLGKPVELMDRKQESLYEICAASVGLWKITGHKRVHDVKVVQPRDIEPVLIIADAGRLQQVILNLLDNASQHTPEDGEIRIVIHEPEVERCRVQIIDSGTGISEETSHRVFEPFYSTRRGGVGLGMSIVKQIIENHGGYVKIENNDPEPGCSVEINLPILKRGI